MPGGCGGVVGRGGVRVPARRASSGSSNGVETVRAGDGSVWDTTADDVGQAERVEVKMGRQVDGVYEYSPMALVRLRELKSRWGKQADRVRCVLWPGVDAVGCKVLAEGTCL